MKTSQQEIDSLREELREILLEIDDEHVKVGTQVVDKMLALIRDRPLELPAFAVAFLIAQKLDEQGLLDLAFATTLSRLESLTSSPLPITSDTKTQ